MRQVILDTETTGIDPKDGHRLVEIGAIEMVNRRFTGRTYHQYINPERHIDAEVVAVHGIDDARVANEPVFAAIADEFWAFIEGAELVIHNAPFDVGFINHEIAKLSGAYQVIESGCRIIDTLALARQKHPGQKNNLDALCKRYGVDNSQRDLHGALLDAEILADVYLLMTGGQVNLNISGQQSSDGGQDSSRGGIRRLPQDRQPLRVVTASEEELELHQQKLDAIHKSSGNCVWMNGGD